MIYRDEKLNEWALNNAKNYQPKNINPASIDLVLGDSIQVPRWYWLNPITRLLAWHWLGKPDPRKYTSLYLEYPKKFNRYTLWPGRFVLCHSVEFTTLPEDAAAILLSKSTTGRIGLEHLHAGYGDPGFAGNWTWELVNLSPWPIELVAGQRLVQLVLISVDGKPSQDYADVGRYQGQVGVTSARSQTEYVGGKIAAK